MTATATDRLRWAEGYLSLLTQSLATAESDLLELAAQHDEAARQFVVSGHPAWARARLLTDAQRRHAAAADVLPRVRRNHWAALERRDRAAAAVSADQQPPAHGGSASSGVPVHTVVGDRRR